MRRLPAVVLLVLLAAVAVPESAAAARSRHHRAHAARAVSTTLYDYAGEGLSCIAGATDGDLDRPTSSSVVQFIVPQTAAQGGQLKTVFDLQGALPNVTYFLGAGNNVDGCLALSGSLTTDAKGDGSGVIYTPVNPLAGGFFAYVIHPEAGIPPEPLAIMFSTLVRRVDLQRPKF